MVKGCWSGSLTWLPSRQPVFHWATVWMWAEFFSSLYVPIDQSCAWSAFCPKSAGVGSSSLWPWIGSALLENEWMDVRRQQSCHLGSQSKSHWSVDKSDMHSRFVFLDNSACGCFNRTFVSLVYWQGKWCSVSGDSLGKETTIATASKPADAICSDWIKLWATSNYQWDPLLLSTFLLVFW